MLKLGQDAVRRLWAWIVQPRPGALLIRTGAGLVAIGLSFSLAIVASFPIRGERFYFKLDTSGGTPLYVSVGVVVVGVLCIAAGGLWAYAHYRLQERRLDKRKVVAIELQGLRGGPSTSLADSIPDQILGRRDPLVLDIRGQRDGEVSDPEAALDALLNLPAELRRRQAGMDPSDVVFVYGGLASVPYVFLTGVLVDDEAAVQVMDWDRHANQWRQLTEADDGKRLIIDRSELGADTAEVALAVSLSYRVDPENVRKKFGAMPLVTAVLEDARTDAHWSEQKQIELTRQFLDLLIHLSNVRVQKVHLFLAAPASLAFRMGRVYDKRNLPSITVYQYEPQTEGVFPWGVEMPVASKRKAVLVRL